MDSTKELMSPLPIKLQLMKNFVKGMDKNGVVTFRTRWYKYREGIFVVHDMRNLFKDENFDRVLEDREDTDLESFSCWDKFNRMRIIWRTRRELPLRRRLHGKKVSA